MARLWKIHPHKKMTELLTYFINHSHRMNYAYLKKQNLPIGSGQVESAVRRIINLRFKAPGSFWKEETAESLMHLRAVYKAGRWDEMMERILDQKFHLPSFEATTITGGKYPENSAIDNYDFRMAA